MKKIFTTVITLVCLLGAVNVYATEAVRIWQNSAGDGFPAFQAAMQQNGWADASSISTYGLARVAYDFAKRKDFLALAPESNREMGPYMEMFLRWNGLHGDKITHDQFRVRGQNIGWYLPVELEETVSKPAPLALVKDELQKLSDEFRQMSTQVDTSRTSIMDFSARLSSLESKIGPLTLKTSSVLGTLNAVQVSLQAIEGGTFTAAMFAAVDTRVKGQLEELEGRITTLEKTTAEQGGQIGLFGRILAFLAVLVILLGIGLIWLGRKQDAQTKAHEGILKTHGEILNGVESDSGSGLVEKFSKLEVSLADLEKKLQKTHRVATDAKREARTVKELSVTK